MAGQRLLLYQKWSGILGCNGGPQISNYLPLHARSKKLGHAQLHTDAFWMNWVQKPVYIFCQKLGGIFDCNHGWCLLTTKASYCPPIHVRSRKLGHASLYPHQTKNGPCLINVRCESSRRYRLLTSKLTHHSSAICWVLQIQFSALWRPNEEGVPQFQQGLLRNSCNVFWFDALNVALCTAKIRKKA